MAKIEFNDELTRLNLVANIPRIAQQHSKNTSPYFTAEVNPS